MEGMNRIDSYHFDEYAWIIQQIRAISIIEHAAEMRKHFFFAVFEKVLVVCF